MNTERQATGFTLVEVLVALAVVVVAFMAMYGSLQQMVGAAILMQEKTFASWVAFDEITKMRINGDFPTGEKSQGEAEMAGVTWLYSMEFNKRSDDILQVIVRVTTEDEPGREVALATGVLYRPPQNTPSGPPGQQPSNGKNENSGKLMMKAGATDGSLVEVPGETDDGIQR
ncbi:MAG: type II secretion system minor pseudopilin GspI [Gammaproteobacteria bacterium]|jgi:general secretion pathway protein I|nr:type II secretion system minor pseudopilin GspI [Gammaproteobacteria bacterium]MDP6694972.1 type II secretion system minor pseudopilin GspI [Gammaproteobacteria bacterium]